MKGIDLVLAFFAFEAFVDVTVENSPVQEPKYLLCTVGRLGRVDAILLSMSLYHFPRVPKVFIAS
jgi:hypothetical protein